MKNMSEISNRMDLQQACAFVLEGLENTAVGNDTYESRLKKGSRSIYKRLESICQNDKELDEAVSDLTKALVAYESVYTEIGMKLGARIVCQMLQ